MAELGTGGDVLNPLRLRKCFLRDGETLSEPRHRFGSQKIGQAHQQ